MKNEDDVCIEEDADRSLAKYIGSYENINPELYSKYGQHAYALVDDISGELANLTQIGDENVRLAFIDDKADELSQKFPMFTMQQIKELILHFVEYYFSCMQ